MTGWGGAPTTIRGVHIDAWDEVFIRCRRPTVNALVTHVSTWDRWWPGLAVHPAGGAGRYEVTLATGWRSPRRQRLLVTVDRVRPRDKGLEWSVAGDLVGTGEWYHLDEPDGVVVHYLLRGTLQHGDPRRWLSAHRASVRRALTDLKARLEGGRLPGAEPHPALLGAQAEELRIFAEEVARHRAELAALAAPAAAGPAVGTGVQG